MCGLAGVFAYGHGAQRPNEREGLAIRDHMRARGPDGAGLWRSPDGETMLLHRRLSILDLSARGAQPMMSADGRFVVVYNGEIYNYPALRRMLEQDGARFVTDCDTELLLHLFAREGPDMLARLRGMYAFAIWDSAERRLHLARDPLGIKPLYYADDGKTFRFASQVKALLAGGGVDAAPDPAGVAGFCLFGSVPEPFTFHAAIRALPAGHALTIDADGAGALRAFETVGRLLTAVSAPPGADTAAAAIEALRGSVAAHLLADVPVGLFLSGGVDSGALLGLMRAAGARDVRAITLRFDEFAGSPFDEAPCAARLAALYGAQHIVRQVTPAEFADDEDAVLTAMDQPSIDGVNVWFVAKAAKEAGLRAALSGIGGDEAFAGYSTFQRLPWMHRLRRLPARLPGFGAGFRRASTRLAPGLAARHPKAVSLFECGDGFEAGYFLLRALFLPHELPALLGPRLAREGLERLDLPRLLRAADAPGLDDCRRICALESGLYLRNQLLRDADWAGMAHSVEIRTPFVDRDVLRAAAPMLPGLAPGAGKALLASAPRPPLPADIAARPKSGFSVPMRFWRGEGPAARLGSRGWARRVLAAAGVETGGSA